MEKVSITLGLILVLAAGLVATGQASATTSAGFREVNEDIFDDWGVSRTRANGEDGFYQISETGFRPIIAFESLGEEAELAYRLGEQMAAKYPDRQQRAEEIFFYVRNRVRYVTDIDQFELDEFAQNADEVAGTIEQDGVAYGDCEDSAVLLAVMYRGAGYRSAIAVAPGHTAAMVYLPEYKKAQVFELEGEPGWVWLEATARNNPPGWVPKEFIDAKVAVYEISEEPITPAKVNKAPLTAVTKGDGGGTGFPFPFFSIIAFLWFMPLFRRNRRR
ncbi:MAG: transglutaminase domain-containing protein [Dehalococcoidales bacterium]|jgi:hypothetical protein|nr:transglutaminase domain-containing protein [Dehalococcoidales bacterium]MDP6576917.1 transglutaminase domain-containing protein [Dehalococcoidales bacterium]